jgi:hypothetical protein
MPAQTSNLFDSVRSIASEITRRWNGNKTLGGYDLNMAVSNTPLSVRPKGSNDVFDYFLVQLQGKAHLKARAGNQVNAYAIYLELFDGAELIDSSPDTSVASTSYSASVSTTVGGSFGFFGDELTGTVSASETISRSTTQTVADLRIQNLEDDNAIAFLVARDSLMAMSETPLLVQYLIKRPHTSGDLRMFLNFRAYFKGGDLIDNANDPDWSGVDQFFTVSGRITKRNCKSSCVIAEQWTSLRISG